MTTSYPASKQSIPNPVSTDLLKNADATLDHDYQHSTINDTIEALQDKVGIDGSAVTTSHDYKLSGVTGSDKAVSKTGTEILTNKTLTSPQINFGSDATGDLMIRNGLGVTSRLAIGTEGQIPTVRSGTLVYEANAAASDASTTVKGVSELATLAETLARTTTGGTGAKLVVTPDNLTTVQTYDYAADSVGTDAYAITVTPAPTAYVTGQTFTFKAGTANTGACTLNVNSLGAKTIKTPSGNDTVTGDILANQIVKVVYDGTNFQTTNQLASVNPITYTANTDSGITTWITNSIDFNSSLWTKAGSGLAYSANGAQITGNTSAYAYAPVVGGAGTYSTLSFNSSGYSIRLKAHCFNAVNTSTTAYGFFGFENNTTGTAAGDITSTGTDKVGFAWYNGLLYTVTCNGTSITATSRATRAGQQWDSLALEFDGTTATFYINGTSYTQTTNVPDSGAMYVKVSGSSGAGGTGVGVAGATISTKYNA